MSKKKKVVEKKAVKKITKIAKVVKKVKEVIKKPDDLKAIAVKRQSLIDEITPTLLSNSALKRGGFGIRSAYGQESTKWNGVIAEINELGAKLSMGPIGLGHMRK